MTTEQNSAPVLVLGGTGKTGRRVTAELTRRGFTARPASRKATTRFDWSDPDTWGPALEGVRAVYLVDSQGPDAAAEVRAFARLAAERGVQRLVLLSARVWGEVDDPAFRATEDAVTGSGLDWTILRPGWFVQNFTEEWFLSSVFTTGELRIPTGEGREAFIDLEDLAEVAAVALTEDGHVGETYVLSGPRALTLGETLAEIGAAVGRPLRHVPVSDEEYLADQRAAGTPEEVAQLLVQLFRHIREGRSEALGDGVQRVLGREPRALAAYVAATDFGAVLAQGSAQESAG
jgi:uncharacterized protein YbjT (DUF2867 family)